MMIFIVMMLFGDGANIGPSLGEIPLQGVNFPGEVHAGCSAVGGVQEHTLLQTGHVLGDPKDPGATGGHGVGCSAGLSLHTGIGVSRGSEAELPEGVGDLSLPVLVGAGSLGSPALGLHEVVHLLVGTAGGDGD